MRLRFPLQREIPFEFVYELFSLLAAIIVVHAVYVTLVRPRAAADLEQEAILREQDESYVPERSVYVVIRDLEQEACFVLTLWAFAILGYKGRNAIRERRLLYENLVPIDEGTKILASDARSFERQIKALPPALARCFLPRCLLSALHRFESSHSISDAAATVESLCKAEGERLDSELSMIRYIVWAIPSIGFIGTVRGIGQALALAYQAIDGNITGVTQSLGIAFNSTFVALLLSLVLMLLVHQLQLLQERLVLETQDYCSERLIRHMEAGAARPA
ncbi:MAG TPA: MotA/TolQ/ExbB proton channel family protein [Myxococcota bacterium]|nr:MotA/TolQ/ExbB proton channel family protein [Myxococcota bacterium]